MHKKTHGNKLAKQVTEKNNANLCSSQRGSTGNNKDCCFLCGKSELGIMFGVSRDPQPQLETTLKLIYYTKRLESEKTLSKTACINIHTYGKNFHIKRKYITCGNIKAVLLFIVKTLTKQIIQT